MRACLVAVLGILAARAYYGFGTARAASLVSAGSPAAMTEDEAIDRSTSLAEQLNVDTAGTRAAAEERLHTGFGRARVHLWDVTFTDRAGEGLLRVTWGARSGDLLSVRLRSPHSAPTDTALDAAGATQAAWHWMSVLGFARKAPVWRPIGKPSRTAGCWFTVWEGDGRTTAVTLSATGGLVSAFTRLDASRRLVLPRG